MLSKIVTSNTTAIIFLILLAVVGILVLNYAFQPTMNAYDWNEETYRVRTGESLWTISADYCPDGVDRREWISAVQELNGMNDSTVYQNQKLTVLAPVK